MKHLPIILFALLIAGGCALFPSCSKTDDVPVAKPTLYDTLGGTTLVTDPANKSAKIETGRLGIRSVVDSTIFVIAADSRINGFFEVLLVEVTSGSLSGFQDLSKELTDFFCAATGSKNFSYTGLNMSDAHNPAKNPRMKGKATNASFNAFIEDLVAGAKKNGLPDAVIAKIGVLVESQRTLVVQQ
jgi:hypothetical protein